METAAAAAAVAKKKNGRRLLAAPSYYGGVDFSTRPATTAWENVAAGHVIRMEQPGPDWRAI